MGFVGAGVGVGVVVVQFGGLVMWCVFLVLACFQPIEGGFGWFRRCWSHSIVFLSIYLFVLLYWCLLISGPFLGVCRVLWVGRWEGLVCGGAGIRSYAAPCPV